MAGRFEPQRSVHKFTALCAVLQLLAITRTAAPLQYATCESCS
jgi:hypothetical protein